MQIQNQAYFIPRPVIVTSLFVTVFFILNFHVIGDVENYGVIPTWYLDDCNLLEFPEIRAPLEKWFLCASYQSTGNLDVFAFLFSAGLIPVTFLLARKITKSEKRAYLASGLLLLSPIIGKLGTTGALTSDWAFFFFLSLYMGYKKPALAGPLLIMSIACKALPMLVLPLVIYFVYKSNMPKKKIVMYSYVAVGAIVLSLWASGDSFLIQQDGLRWNVDQWQTALYDMWYVFRSDPAQLALIPISLALCYFSKDRMARPVMYLIGSLYSLVFLLPVFSMYVMFDYRMTMLIIFASLGISLYKR